MTKKWGKKWQKLKKTKNGINDKKVKLLEIQKFFFLIQI